MLDLTIFQDTRALNDTYEVYEILKLNNNLLPSIDIRFPSFGFKMIDLSNNKISKIDERAFSKMKQLEEIDLSHNKLSSNRYSYGQDFALLSMWQLKRLRLGFNSFTNLKSSIFAEMDNLEELYLDNNDFTFDSYSSDNLSPLSVLDELKVLDLSHCQIRYPTQLFLSNLETLKLDWNRLDSISYTLSSLTGLKELSLDGNPLVTNHYDYSGGRYREYNTFDGFISIPMSNLEKLNMSFTQIETIGEGTMSGLASLKELRLTNNANLSSIHPSAFITRDKPQYPPIKKLFLNNNKLSTLSIRTLTGWFKMEEINLNNNPWKCDCELQWVVDFLVPVMDKTTPHLMDETKCAEPRSKNGMKLLELNENNNELYCEYQGPFAYIKNIFDHIECGDLPTMTQVALLVALIVGGVLGFFLGLPTGCLYKACRYQCKDGCGSKSSVPYRRVDQLDDENILAH